MLERSGGWPGADNAEGADCENRTGTGGTSLPPRSNQDINEKTRENAAKPMATHGTIVCTFDDWLGTTAVKDAPHAWHAREPGFTFAPQEGHVATIGAPQWLQNLPEADFPQPGH